MLCLAKSKGVIPLTCRAFKEISGKCSKVEVECFDLEPHDGVYYIPLLFDQMNYQNYSKQNSSVEDFSNWEM